MRLGGPSGRAGQKPKSKSGTAASKAQGTRSRPEPRAGTTTAFPTERKYVTILRVDLHQSTERVVGLELEQGIALLAPAMAAMRAGVHAHGGIVYKEMGDGLFAVFGAPIAEDLHAVMGCMAALDVRARIQAISDPAFQARVGVHSGQVVAGPRKLDLATTYEFDGPALIVAERLQSVAKPGEILASSECRTLAEGYVRFGAEAAHALKGFSEPVTVHAVESIGDLSKWSVGSNRARSVFVGRTAEFDRLEGLTQRVGSQARGTRAAVVGEAGVGKSRLAREFVGRMKLRHWNVIEAECSPIVGQTPFALLKALLGDMAKPLGAARSEELDKRLSIAERAALQIMVRDADATTLPEWTRLPPKARNRAIVGATCALAELRLSEAPCLCLIEDLQWADEASAAAMEGLLALSDSQPLVVLATARTGGLPSWFAKSNPEVLCLDGLSSDGGQSLLENLLGPSPRLHELKQRILQHTGALPLFIEETCRDLVEGGGLKGSWGAFEPASADTNLGVPLTVQGVIAGRIDRLSLPEKRLLQVASAIGPRGSMPLLKSVAALPDSAFRQSLAALFGSAMLLPSETALPARHGYAFPHELVRQVTYDAILVADRSALHAQIFAGLEKSARQQGAERELAGALVHHALLSSQWARAAEHATVIARQSLTHSAFPDAQRHYETAMLAVDRLPSSQAREAQAIDLRIEARQAYANVGRIKRWLELANEADTRAAAANETARQIVAVAVRAAALNFCGTAAEAVEAGRQAVSAAANSTNRGWLAYAEYGLGQAYYVAGRYRQSVQALEAARHKFLVEGCLPPMGGSPAQAALLCCMMCVLSHVALGDAEAAADAQLRADDIATQDGRPLAAIASGLGRGALLAANGMAEEAARVLSAALTLSLQHEINLFVPIVATHQGLALFLSGQADEAFRAFDTAHLQAEELGHYSASFRAQLYKIVCTVSKESRPNVLAAVRSLKQRVRQQGYDPLEMEAAAVESALLRAQGLRREAEGCEVEARSICDRLDAKGAFSILHRAIGRLHGRSANAAHEFSVQTPQS